MEEPLYNDSFVAHLFDRMSLSYGFMNQVTSMGFYPFWRRQAIKATPLKKDDQVADLLTGPGDCWKYILPEIGKGGKLTALDFSEGMIKQAEKKKLQYPRHRIDLLQKNVFKSGIADESQDVVICCYGLKTFDQQQLQRLACEMLRILKPGGVYSLVEVAMPESERLKTCYQFYLGKVIPFLSKLLAKHPETYNYLEIYSSGFEGFDILIETLEKEGGQPKVTDMFFGCAKGISGKKL